MHRYHFYTTIPPLSFQNFITVFSSEFLLLNAIFNFKFFIDILFRILIACKYYTTFNVLLLCFNDRLICGFSLCRIVSVFSQKPCCVYINKSTHANAVIKRCFAKWVFSQCSKSCRKNIFEWTHFCEFWMDLQKFMKVKILSWLFRENLSLRIFTWSWKLSQWNQKVLNCEYTKKMVNL